MKIFNADRQRNLEVNNLLQRIKYKADKQGIGSYVYFPIFTINNNDFKYEENLSTITLFENLKKWGVIEVIGRNLAEQNKTLKESRKLKNKLLISEGYLVRPIEPKFSQLCKKLKNRIKSRRFEDKTGSKTKDARRLITKDDNKGDYFYDGKRIEMSKTTIYYKIFNILFSQCNQEGFLSYEDVERYLIKIGEPESIYNEIRNKRINNAIINQQQGLFRFAKVNGRKLVNKVPNGKKLIESIRGKGLQLNNPKI